MMTRMTPMEMTAAGMEADIVMPTRSPRYALAAPKTTARMIPSMMAVGVNSGMALSAGTKGLVETCFSDIALLLFENR